MSPANMESVYDDICTRFKISKLTNNQVKSIKAVYDGKDVLVGTKTGSGKSLTYECLPVMIPGGCVLVIAPLVLIIMSDQCRKLTDLGFRATYIGKDVSETEAIQQGYFDFVFGSPEMLIGKTEWRDMLKSAIYQDRLKMIVVELDEAHTVIQWGLASGTDTPFREWFSRIGEFRFLCPKATIAALTATSAPIQRRKIIKSLCIGANCEVILESPDRDNSKISSICLSNFDLDPSFKWLIDDLQTQQKDLPRHDIFCESIATVSKLYSIFFKYFGKDCPYFALCLPSTKTQLCSSVRCLFMVPCVLYCLLHDWHTNFCW